MHKDISGLDTFMLHQVLQNEFELLAPICAQQVHSELLGKHLGFLANLKQFLVCCFQVVIGRLAARNPQQSENRLALVAVWDPFPN